MIESHPDVAVPRESYFIDTMLRRRDGFERNGVFLTEEFLAELTADVRFLRWEIAPDLTAEMVRAARPGDLAAAIRAVYSAFATSRGVGRVCDKTPLYSLRIPALAELFPEARFVNLVRDGRDVAASYVATDFGPRGLTAAAAYWRRVVRATDRAERVLGAERMRTFRYEDLVAGPEDVLVEICRFLELEYDPRMLDYTAHRRTALRQQPGSTRAKLDGPLLTGARDWRADLRPPEVTRIETIAGRELSRHGYQLSGSEPTRWARVGIGSSRVVFESVHRGELAVRRTRTFNRVRSLTSVW